MANLLIGKKWLDLDTSLLLLGFSDFQPIAKRLGIALIEGRLFDPAAREIAIGQKAARILKLGIGNRLQLDSDAPYTITGIYSIGLDFLDACAYMDIGDAQRLLQRPDQTGMLFISLKNPSDAERTIALINASHAKVVAFPGGELIEHLGSRKTTIRFIQLISIIAFVIASVVLLNTLVITINERTREIGILMAIGWSRRMIITIFGVESLLLAYSGAVAGLLLTYPIFLLLGLSPNIGLNFLPRAPSSEMFGLLLIACTVMGILSAVFPAIYSTRMLPAKALRFE
jgi:putative ABC transport system permease protein